MGQYYFTIVKNGTTRYTMPDVINGDWVGLKLCEIATNLQFSNALTNFVHEAGKPVRIATIGDYAHPESGGSAAEKMGTPVARSFCKNATEIVTVKTGMPFAEIAVNHDRKEYVFLTCGGYSPLVMLTAVGNGLGGGDYMGKGNRHLVGSWAYDKVSVKSYDQRIGTILRTYKCLNEDGESLFPFEF